MIWVDMKLCIIASRVTRSLLLGKPRFLLSKGGGSYRVAYLYIHVFNAKPNYPKIRLEQDILRLEVSSKSSNGRGWQTRKKRQQVNDPGPRTKPIRNETKGLLKERRRNTVLAVLHFSSFFTTFFPRAVRPHYSFLQFHLGVSAMRLRSSAFSAPTFVYRVPDTGVAGPGLCQ